MNRSAMLLDVATNLDARTLLIQPTCRSSTESNTQIKHYKVMRVECNEWETFYYYYYGFNGDY